MADIKHIQTPLSRSDITALRAGDNILLSGVIYTARDAAHKRMVEQLAAGEPTPFPFDGAAVFYAGPSPTPPGGVIGSIGPTTSGRMDAYSPALIARGLRVMIGKGERSDAVVAAMRAHTAVYLAAVGGIAALMSACVTSAEVVAYDDLGTEAVRRLTVTDLPLVVAIDANGNSMYNR